MGGYFHRLADNVVAAVDYRNSHIEATRKVEVKKIDDAINLIDLHAIYLYSKQDEC